MNFRKRIIAFVMLITLLFGCLPAVASTYNMPYYIDVDLTNQFVTVYNTKDGSIARQMLCSSGINNKTPTGTWYLPKKRRSDERTEWYHMKSQYCWVKWCTNIHYAYFFHSITFSSKDDNSMLQEAIDAFGRPASHGCIRLRVEDAKFIAQNCLAGTRVKIFKSGQKDDELHDLLYISSYSQDDMTYNEFWGNTVDGLGRGASGSEVVDLQHRLRDLGYYSGSYDGAYADDVIASMKALQKDLGIKQSGIASRELLELIYSDEAPVSMGTIALREGDSGPIVKKIQESLTDLALYSGPVDGIYDSEVVKAVTAFQRLTGFEADGVASTDVQHTLAYVPIEIEQAIGTDDFTTELLPEEITTAVIKAKQKIIVRSDADSESSDIGRVSNGDQVMVYDVDGDWAKIGTSKGSGYIKKKYLTSPGKITNYIFKYNGGGKTYTLGRSLLDEDAPRDTVASRARAYYSSRDFSDSSQGQSVPLATVDTSAVGQNVALNLRAEPDKEAEVLMAVNNGMSMRVLGSVEGWTKVSVDDYIGYLMTDYLKLWEGTEAEVEQVLAAQETYLAEIEDDPVYCMINSGNVNLYAEASTSSAVVTKMGKDAILEILDVDEANGWQHICYNNMEGYVESKYVTDPIGA